MLASLHIGLATWLAFVIIAIAVGAVAGYLIVVAWILNHVSFTVGTVLIGVRAIVYQTEPVDGVVKGILNDVTQIQNALRGLLPPSALPPSRRAPQAAVSRHKPRPVAALGRRPGASR